MSGKLSARRLQAEEEQAEDYAAAIRGVGWIKPDWKALNARLIDEYGLAGLVRIKRRAWRLVEGSGTTPVSQSVSGSPHGAHAYNVEPLEEEG